MSATRDLIAAALRLTAIAERNTDDRDEWQHSISEVREMCARAMVEPAAPDMAEVERLVGKHAEASALLQLCRVTDLSIADRRYKFVLSRTALLDYVRGIMEERDAMIADNERLMQIAAQEVSAGPQPVGEFCTDYHCPGDCGLNGHGYQHAPQPVGAAEVPMPEINYDGFYLIDRFLRNNLNDDDYAEYMSGLQQYGDAREAAGYAAGLRELLDCRTCRNYTRHSCIQTAQCVDGDGYRRAAPVRFWSAALRGEVKP